MEDKAVVREKMQQLIEMTAGFCDKYLDEEYKELCEKLIRKMARKRSVPFLYGRMEIWAAAVIHAIGSINFLFDPSFEPYASLSDIANYFGTSKSTTTQKSKLIRDMFKMRYWDREFSTTHMMEHNPFSKLAMIDGFIVGIDSLPPELRETIQRDRNQEE
nr:DUF6398 domain-containing protein [Candidatus Freyarchaeota archaeon]